MPAPVPPIPGATKNPSLPKIVEGRWYLDVPADSTIEDIRVLTQHQSLEILSVFDGDGRLLYAPLVGERASVLIHGFAGELKNRYVAHNHPSGTMLSDDDLREAIECNMAGIEAVLPSGKVLSLDRPQHGWPNVTKAIEGYDTADARVKAVARKKWKQKIALTRDQICAAMLKQVNKTLGKTKTFGQNALTIKESTVK